jgi:hypothetical protein
MDYNYEVYVRAEQELIKSIISLIIFLYIFISILKLKKEVKELKKRLEE